MKKWMWVFGILQLAGLAGLVVLAMTVRDMSVTLQTYDGVVAVAESASANAAGLWSVVGTDDTLGLRKTIGELNEAKGHHATRLDNFGLRIGCLQDPSSCPRGKLDEEAHEVTGCAAGLKDVNDLCRPLAYCDPDFTECDEGKVCDTEKHVCVAEPPPAPETEGDGEQADDGDDEAAEGDEATEGEGSENDEAPPSPEGKKKFKFKKKG